MSGTSLDGIDLVYVSLVKEQSWSFQINYAQTIPYTKAWKTRLSEAINLNDNELSALNSDYTRLLSSVILEFIANNNILEILAICSHGHTVLHQPEKGLTLQIGNLPTLAALVGYNVVCDFRVKDVQLGGQGAPLVPIGDELLFNEYTHCLNLGGFANVSYRLDGVRIAYDLCPVNVVMNYYALMLGKEYDTDGAFAKAGNVNGIVLNKLNRLAYYKHTPPKSLGMEWVNSNIWNLLDPIESVNDKLATFLEHAAIQIASNTNSSSKVLVTGGGAYNKHLIKRIKKHSNAYFHIPNNKLVEFKEAVIFAFLGVLRLRNENNCLASVTGASKDHCSGKIYVP